MIFFWIMFLTASPITPQRLQQRFPLCDLRNVTSWDIHKVSSLDLLSYIKTKNVTPFTNYVEVDIKPTNQATIYCRRNIDEMALYKAFNIGIVYELSQPVKLSLGIHRLGQGPIWGPVVIKEEDVNKKLTNTWSLVDIDKSKLNWLSGVYDRAFISLEPLNPSALLVFRIYDIYLE